MSSGSRSPSPIQNGNSTHDDDNSNADSTQQVEVAEESQERQAAGVEEGKEEKEEGRRRSSRRAATIQPPPPPKKTTQQRQRPTSTASQKLQQLPAEPALRQPLINPNLPPPPIAASSLKPSSNGRAHSPPPPPPPPQAQPAPPAPFATTTNGSGRDDGASPPFSITQQQHKPKSATSAQSPSRPASSSSPPQKSLVASQPFTNGFKVLSPSRITPARVSPAGTPSQQPLPTPSAEDGNASSSRVSAPPSSASRPRPSATPSKPLKIVEEGGREVIELGDSDDDDEDDEEDEDESAGGEAVPQSGVKQEVQDISDSGDDDDDSEDEDEDDDDGSGSDVELLTGPGGDQSEGDEDMEDRSGGDGASAMEGIVEGGPASGSGPSSFAPNGVGSTINLASRTSVGPSSAVPLTVSNDNGEATNAVAGPSQQLTELVVKKVVRKRKTPSPSPPPPFRKPDITLRLNVPLVLEKGKYDEFSLYEKAFEAGVYDQEVMSIFSLRGQREEEIAAVEKAAQEQETEEQAMARRLEEKYGGEETAKVPKKRRKRRELEDDYDVYDPFIDDSTAGIDAPEFTGVTVQEGFFVHMGAVELKEMEAPAPKPRARKSVDPNGPKRPRASEGGPAHKRVKLDGTPLSPHSSMEYMGGLGSPTGEMMFKRAPPVPSPEPEPPKPEISPEVEEELVLLKREVDKCDWTNKGKFPPHLRPIVLEVAKTAIQTECFTPPFFDRMPAIFPYNKYTITKLIKKEASPFLTQFLADRRASLIAAFQKEVDAVKEERIAGHEQAVVAWEEEEIKKAEQAKEDALKPPEPVVPSVLSYVPLSNRSATPEVSPAAAADDSKPSKDTKDKEPEGPIKKFTFSPEMKRLLWQLHLCIVQTLDHLNDIAKYTNPSAPDVGLTSANKQLYADLVHCFPAGYMTTTNLSRALSALKDADKKRQAAAEKIKAERELRASANPAGGSAGGGTPSGLSREAM